MNFSLFLLKRIENQSNKLINLWLFSFLFSTFIFLLVLPPNLYPDKKGNRLVVTQDGFHHFKLKSAVVFLQWDYSTSDLTGYIKKKKLSQNKFSSLTCFCLSVLLETYDGNQVVGNWGFLTLGDSNFCSLEWFVTHSMSHSRCWKQRKIQITCHKRGSWSMCAIFLYQWSVNPLLPIGAAGF